MKYLKRKKIFFSKSIKIKDFADVVYDLFVLKKFTVDENGSQQCSSGRLRSIIDCKCVCEAYNINGPITKAVRSMYGKFLKPSYCTTVKRIVHSSTGDKEAIRKYLEQKNFNFKING